MTLRATRTSTTQLACSLLAILGSLAAVGCESGPTPYGNETLIFSPRYGPKSFAITPALNLSGQRTPDPLLQADIVYQELQQIRGVTVVPVNRSVQALVGLDLRQVESTEQAFAVCDALGVDALVVPTITAFDPYDPPKFGGSLQIFVRNRSDRNGRLIDVRALRSQATGRSVESMPRNADFIQAVRMFDASAGSTRMRVDQYAAGRTDPAGPLGTREFYLNMDKYCAFAWHELIEEALKNFGD